MRLTSTSECQYLGRYGNTNSHQTLERILMVVHANTSWGGLVRISNQNATDNRSRSRGCGFLKCLPQALSHLLISPAGGST